MGAWPVTAQETWGIANSNFAGNMGVGLNPSSIVGGPYKKEFLLVAGDVFEDNNFVYLKRNSGVIRKSLLGETVPEGSFGDHYTETPLKRGYASGYLQGPSYIRNYGKWAWAAHMSYRSANSVTDLPYHLAKFIKEGFDYVPQHGIRYTAGPFKADLMGWFELGGTYARVLRSTGNEEHVVKAGITLSAMAGSYGIWVDANSLDYIVPNSQLLIVNNLDGQYAHASAQDGDRLFRDMTEIRGWGGRTDIGITYINHMNRGAYDCNLSADYLRKYRYRLGLSLMDFGLIRYTTQQTRVLSIDSRSAYWPGIDTMKFLHWYYVDTTISSHFYGSPSASRRGDRFTMFLPMAVSLQFDYNLKPRYYLNLSAVQRVPVGSYPVRRPNQMALTARYETRRWELAVPLSFFEYKQLSLGLAWRYGILVIGTDRLGTFTGLFNSTGFDLFFGLKWTGCHLRNEKRKSNGMCW